MLTKKSIVLNGVENENKRAVLSMECNGEMTNGRVRLYNFGTEPRGIISLGIFAEGKVFKAGLTYTAGMLYTFSCNLPKLPDVFSCAVINIAEGNSTPILYGNSEGMGEQDRVIEKVISSLSQTSHMEEVEKTLNEYNIDYEDALKEEIEKEIDSCISSCTNCEDCIYKQFYNSHIKTLKEEEKDINELEENNKFYLEMKGQIDEIFAKNPTDEYLENLIPNSKWVKVNVDEEGNYYVLGLVYEENKLQYICYGVPGVYQKLPPRQLSGYPVWFPLDESKPQGFGYWLSYQDADSGESVKAVLI